MEGNDLLAVVTLLLAAATVWLATSTKAQSSATEQLASLSLAAEIDRQSPSVVAYCSTVQWPPSSGFGSDALKWDHDQAFDLEQHGFDELAFTFFALIRNESDQSAIVMGLGESEFACTEPPAAELETGRAGGVKDKSRFVAPVPIGNGKYVIPGGGEAHLRCRVRKTVKNWSVQYERRRDHSEGDPSVGCSVNLVVVSAYDMSARDHVTLQLAGYPLVPNEGSTVRWRFAGGPAQPVPVKAVVAPIRRERFISMSTNQLYEARLPEPTGLQRDWRTLIKRPRWLRFPWRIVRRAQ